MTKHSLCLTPVEQGRIDVVYNPQSDNSSTHGTGASRPMVLVQLPRMVAGEPSRPIQPAPSSAETVAAQPPRDHLPTNALHEDSGEVQQTKDWLDRRHEEIPTERRRSRASVETSHETTSTRKTADYRFDYPHRGLRSRRSRTWAARLVQLNTAMAPYAGLIVTLALIASAGLLYWMIAGEPQRPRDDRPLDYYSGGLSAEVLQVESDAPEFGNQIAEAPEAATIPLFAWRQGAAEKPATPEPESALPPPGEPQGQSRESTHYPQTEIAEPLDFGRLINSGADQGHIPPSRTESVEPAHPTTQWR